MPLAIVVVAEIQHNLVDRLSILRHAEPFASDLVREAIIRQRRSDNMKRWCVFGIR